MVFLVPTMENSAPFPCNERNIQYIRHTVIDLHHAQAGERSLTNCDAVDSRADPLGALVTFSLPLPIRSVRLHRVSTDIFQVAGGLCVLESFLKGERRGPILIVGVEERV